MMELDPSTQRMDDLCPVCDEKGIHNIYMTLVLEGTDKKNGYLPSSLDSSPLNLSDSVVYL